MVYIMLLTVIKSMCNVHYYYHDHSPKGSVSTWRKFQVENAQLGAILNVRVHRTQMVASLN